MNDITAVIASNLAALRRDKHLTLQDLADITGVSKSMLGEIERASSNPTITVLWKISSGLKVPISRLIHDQEPFCSVVKADEQRMLLAPPTLINLLFECDPTRNFEVYQLEFEAGAEHRSTSHDEGVIEYIMVYDGEFAMTVGDKNYVLKKGDSMLFEGRHDHCYANKSETTARAYSIIYYGHV